MSPKNGTLMETARVQLPSGRWTDQAVDLRTTPIEDVAYLVAMYMLSHRTGDRYIGSVGSAMKGIWGDQRDEQKRKNLPRLLRQNGFRSHQESSGRFVWLVPDALPEWHAAPSQDDGAQTTGGAVTTIRVTEQMRALYHMIADRKGRRPGEYAVTLGWPRANVSSVARTLSDKGFIERVGKTMAARYYPTDKPFPGKPAPKPMTTHTREELQRELVEAPPEPADDSKADVHFHRHPKADGPPSPEVIEAATGGTVVYAKDGTLLILKDGSLFRPVQTWTLRPYEQP